MLSKPQQEQEKRHFMHHQVGQIASYARWSVGCTHLYSVQEAGLKWGFQVLGTHVTYQIEWNFPACSSMLITLLELKYMHVLRPCACTHPHIHIPHSDV